MTTASKPALTPTHWLIIIVASLGFLFDTYQLLMTPLVGPAAISELLKVPLSNPAVTKWMANLLWLTALSGGVFGLLGGWLTDKLGRKIRSWRAAFSSTRSRPIAGRVFSQTLPMFITFRCTTFVGVCVEFVAASHLAGGSFFEDKASEAKSGLASRRLFASLGGVLCDNA